MKKSLRNRKKHWFRKIRGSYLPQTWQGWLLYIPYTAYTAGVITFVIVCHYDLGASLFIVVPNLVAALVIMTWIAERAS